MLEMYRRLAKRPIINAWIENKPDHQLVIHFRDQAAIADFIKSFNSSVIKDNARIALNMLFVGLDGIEIKKFLSDLENHTRLVFNTLLDDSDYDTEEEDEHFEYTFDRRRHSF